MVSRAVSAQMHRLCLVDFYPLMLVRTQLGHECLPKCLRTYVWGTCLFHHHNHHQQSFAQSFGAAACNLQLLESFGASHYGRSGRWAALAPLRAAIQDSTYSASNGSLALESKGPPRILLYVCIRVVACICVHILIYSCVVGAD